VTNRVVLRPVPSRNYNLEQAILPDLHNFLIIFGFRLVIRLSNLVQIVALKIEK
jgi:hypothetical protein